MKTIKYTLLAALAAVAFIGYSPYAVREVIAQTFIQLVDSTGTVLSDTTAHAVKTLVVDATGTAVTVATDATFGSTSKTTGPQIALNANVDVSSHTAVTDGQAVRYAGDVIGRGIEIAGCDRTARLKSVTTVTDGSSTSALAAAGANVYNEVWAVAIANTSATAVTVDIRDGTAGSVMATVPVPANTAGVVWNLPVPLSGTANTAVAVDPSAAASSIITTLVGCKGK